MPYQHEYLQPYCRTYRFKNNKCLNRSFYRKSCNIVPFLECLISRTFPTKRTLFCSFIAIIGVGILTLAGNKVYFTSGEVYLFAAAFLYAIAIITTSRLVKSGVSFIIGFFQVTTTGVLSWINIAVEGTLTLPKFPSQYIMIFILAAVCTSFGFTLQPVAQIFLNEHFTLYSITGAALILLSFAIQSNLLRFKWSPA